MHAQFFVRFVLSFCSAPVHDFRYLNNNNNNKMNDEFVERIFFYITQLKIMMKLELRATGLFVNRFLILCSKLYRSAFARLAKKQKS